MREGLYESVLTTGLLGDIPSLDALEAEIADVDPTDHAHVLTRHIAAAIHARLALARDPAERLTLANGLLESINESHDRVEHPVRACQPLVSMASDASVREDNRQGATLGRCASTPRRLSGTSTQRREMRSDCADPGGSTHPRVALPLGVMPHRALAITDRGPGSPRWVPGPRCRRCQLMVRPAGPHNA